MSWPSGDIVGVLTFLLPGFVAASILYSLTSYPKPSPFDRIVQALIFTVIGRAIRDCILLLGSVLDSEPKGTELGDSFSLWRSLSSLDC